MAKMLSELLEPGRNGCAEKESLLAQEGLVNSKSWHSTVAYGATETAWEKGLEPLPSAFKKIGSPSSVRARVSLFFVVFFYMISVLVLPPLTTPYYQDVFRPQFSNDSWLGATNKSSQVPTCDANSSDPRVHQQDKLQEYVAQFSLYVSLAKTVPMVIVTPLLGAASDVMGRRFIFFLPIVTGLLSQSFFAALVWFHLDVHFLFASNALAGVSGDFCVFLLAQFAYTADLTPLAGKARTLGIVLNEFVIRISSTLGKLAIGYMIENVDYFYASLVPVGGFTLALLSLYCLPETVSRRQSNRTEVNPVTYLRTTFAFYISSGSAHERALFRLSFLLLLVNFLCVTGAGGVYVLYQRNAPFCWDPQQMGLFGAISTIIPATSSVLLMRLLQTCCSDTTILVASMLSKVGQFVIIGLAQNDYMLYTSIAASFLSEASVGINRSIMSKMAGSEKQGALFASIAVTESLVSLASSTIYTTVYEATVERMRGAVFLLMAGLTGLNILFTLFFIRMSRSGGTSYETSIQGEDDEKSEGKGDRVADVQWGITLLVKICSGVLELLLLDWIVKNCLQ